MNILYIVSNFTAGSNIIKGVQVVEILKQNGVSIDISNELPSSIENTIIIFVGSLSQSFNLTIEKLRKLKEHSNVLILDPVDSLCYTHLYSYQEIPLMEELNGIIFPNTFAEQVYMEKLKCSSITIPHHFDIRLNTLAVEKQNEFGICYAGSPYRDKYFTNIPNWLYTNFEGHTDRVLEDLIRFPIHFSHREYGTYDFFFKPGTKVATAAATNSILLTSRDKAAVDLLGENYPFYIDDDVNKTEKLVKSLRENYKNYESILSEVKPKVDLSKIYLDYIKFFNTFI